MRVEQRQFKIEGLDCAEEVAVLKRELGPIVGGEGHLSFDLLNGKLTISNGSADVSAETILLAVSRTGMKAKIWEETPGPTPGESFVQRHGRTLLTVASGVCAVAGFITHWGIAKNIQEALGSEGVILSRQIPLAAQALYTLSILAGAAFVLPRAWLAIRRLRPDMNLLMLLAICGAVGLGDWFEAASVAFLFSVSLLLEKWSIGHARRAIETLLDLTPPIARLLQPDRRQIEVAPDQVPVGSILLVKPGERFPLDGRVIKGSSQVNQAPISGESLPVSKSPGDVVFAATINGEGTLEIESTKSSDSTILARLIQMVSEAQSRRSHSEQWVETFSQVYTPVIMGLSLAFFVVPPLLFGGSWHEWFYRSLVLLVIACPCALVISTPVSIVAAIAAAARQGVLIKGGAFVEIPGRLRAIAFDKTGTLTEGKPMVVGVYPLNGHTESELLERIASLEARSEHPLGMAILRFAQDRNLTIHAAEDYQIIPGKGATARIHGKNFWLGTQRYLEELGQKTDEVQSKLELLSRDGVTVVIIGNEQHVCGYLTLADRVRSNAQRAVQALRKLGLEQIVMLTGDNTPTARVIAQLSGVDEFKADLLPAEKVSAIENLVSRYGSVAMVGDGVNDAPAMARSSLGIAMGVAGSDAALETADIALMSDDLTRIPWLVAHSRRTHRIIRANIIFSLVVKAVFVALSLVGFASLWAAITADMGASLLVIFNGLRLLHSTDNLAND